MCQQFRMTPLIIIQTTLNNAFVNRNEKPDYRSYAARAAVSFKRPQTKQRLTKTTHININYRYNDAIWTAARVKAKGENRRS